MPPIRLSRLRKLLREKGLDGIIVSHRDNLAYLIGIHQAHPTAREALLFITLEKAALYHSIFLTPPPSSWVTPIPMNEANSLPRVLTQTFYQSAHLAIEAHNLTVAEFKRMETALPHLKFSLTNDLVETLRLVKDTTELKSIAKASQITAQTMSWVEDLLRGDLKHNLVLSNLTELSLSRLIEAKFYELGAEGSAFPPIVAFDKNSALPHHHPDQTFLKPDSVVLLDFGCQVGGYASDMSRTFCLGPPPPHFTQIEAVVQSAYFAAISYLRHHFTVTELTTGDIKHPGGDEKRQRLVSPGVDVITAASLDHAVRSVIEKADFGKNFIHTSGHGLGLEIHEAPSLSSKNPQALKPGMVLALEPGIYLPGKFGYRYENTLHLD